MSEIALRIKTKQGGPDQRGQVFFLCHNSKDKAFIRQIEYALELEFGTDFFLDVFSIPTGEAFIPWIEVELAKCAGCAIFLGSNGWGPTHLWEAELALARYRRDPAFRVIPVALPGISSDQTAKLGSGKLFQDVNWADFTKGAGDKESLEKLEAALIGRKISGYRGPARLTPYQVRRDSERWSKSGKKDLSILYGGRQLDEAETMIRDNPDFVLIDDVIDFLADSRARQNRFWRRVAIGACATAVILLALSVVAVASYVLAEQRRLGSVSRQLAIASKDAPGADRALLIGARAVLVSDTPEASGALLEQLQDFRFLRRIVGTGSYLEAASTAEDGKFLLGTASGGLLSLSREESVAAPLAGSTRETVTAVASSDKHIWLGREDGRVDVITGGVLSKLLKASTHVPAGRETRVRALAYDMNKDLVAAGTGSGRIAIMRMSDGSVVKDILEGDDVRINSLSFDPTGPRLAAGTSGGMIAIIDTGILRVTQRYPKIDGGVLALGYLRDGSLAAVGGEGRMMFFAGRNPKLEKPRNGKVVPLATAAAIDPDSSRVAVGDSSGVVRLYDAATGQSNGMQPLRGHSDTVTAIVFGRDKNDLMSASSSGSGGGTASTESIAFDHAIEFDGWIARCVHRRRSRRSLASCGR
jgi:WD40 repeat protein